MLTDMNTVWKHYQGELDEVEEQIQGNVNSEVPLINEVARYVLKSGGKRIRPLLLVIASRLCGHSGRKFVPLAGVIEYIHTATLLHDDVIDQAETRRGRQAVWSRWGNQTSILVGDFFYAKSVCNAVLLNDPEVNVLLSQACLRMTEGESLQLVSDGDLNLSESVYLKTIEYKTASLISTACRLGGVVGSATEEQKEALEQFGLKLGMAFQMADDTLDYVANKEQLGKQLGMDFKEGKMTLPLLHLLQHCQTTEREQIRKMLRRGDIAEEELKEVLRLMDRYGSIAYAIQNARDLVGRAKKELSIFKESVHRQSLCIVADYVINRDH